MYLPVKWSVFPVIFRSFLWTPLCTFIKSTVLLLIQWPVEWNSHIYNSHVCLKCWWHHECKKNTLIFFSNHPEKTHPFPDFWYPIPKTLGFGPKISRIEVTLAVVLGGRGKITKALAAKYVLAQLAAAALAGLVPWSRVLGGTWRFHQET